VRPTLTRTLFASFFALTLLVLVATLGLARWSFERGFYEYVRTLERERLALVASELAVLHDELGRDWSALDVAAFERIVRRHAPPGPPGGSALAAGAPPPTRDTVLGRAGLRGPRTALFDTSGRRVAGDRLESGSDGADLVGVPILVDGEPVGELRASVRRRIESPAETAFANRQARVSAAIGAAALALAAVVSWLLARTLLAPVRASIASVARLSRGDYAEDTASVPVAARLDAAGRVDELGRLADDIERLRRTLESGRSARRRLLADVSHELRTPLTILSGEIGAMKDGLRPFDTVQLASLDEEVERLEALVEDLYELSVSDVGGMRYTMETVDVVECLERSVDPLRRAAHDAGIEIELPASGPVELQGDRRRLGQLFANLLSNAVAYTDAPGRIHVAIASTAHEARVTLEDSPPAPRSESCERLFESLYREERSRSRRTGGAGLGLAICRNIVEAHGGRIAATPSALGGLRVDVVLPRHPTGERP